MATIVADEPIAAVENPNDIRRDNALCIEPRVTHCNDRTTDRRDDLQSISAKLNNREEEGG